MQYSFPSREKHFSVKLHLQSQHWTHLTCQALSRTFRRNLSSIGLSHPAQWTIVFGLAPTILTLCSCTPEFSSFSLISLFSLFFSRWKISMKLPADSLSFFRSPRCILLKIKWKSTVLLPLFHSMSLSLSLSLSLLLSLSRRGRRQTDPYSVQIQDVMNSSGVR